MNSRFLWAAILASVATSSYALDFKNWAGGRQVETPPGAVANEICVLSKPMPDVDYEPADQKKEEELCGLSFEQTNGVCPKLISTNPGVDIYDLSAPLTKDVFEAKYCGKIEAAGKAAKKKAKFKQSTSCSYAPSLLAYYHFSRALGGIERVPVAVIRTMDIGQHLAVANKAVSLLAGRNDLIAKTWAELRAADQNIGAHPELYDAQNGLIYGALQLNPRSEVKYSDFNRYASYGTRYTDFMGRPQVRAVMTAVPVGSILGHDNKRNIQTMVQYKDVSDMILIDTLLNQQDRIGNIHNECTYYLLNRNELVGTSDTKCDEPDLPDKNNPDTPTFDDNVLIKKMMLKDNDCGVAKSNKFNEVKALEKLRHMNAETYARFMVLANTLQTPIAMAWMKSELLFTDKDVASIRANAVRMTHVLLSGCQSGQLRLDLDLSAMLAGKLATNTRSLCSTK
jgi:hypothetical protein